MKILVLGGGNSTETDVSLRSAKSVSAAAQAAGLSVTEANPASGLDFLDNLPPETMVFPILHGQGGEDGTLQSELEGRGIAFLGSGSQSSADCFDKWRTRQILEAANTPMPKGILVTHDSYRQHPLAKKPHVLKVRRGGSSIGTLIVRDPSNISHYEIQNLFVLDSEAILEELIVGVELTVPILDRAALPVIEIHPPEGREFDYENKYSGATAEICPPESVSTEQQAAAQKLSENVHELMGCRHLSRVDVMVDETGKLFVLEINTMPGLTDQSLYPKSAAVAGIGMPQLVKKFTDLVKRDYNH